jgi:hypothetical protein
LSDIKRTRRKQMMRVLVQVFYQQKNLRRAG